ncbi:hypothetical protein CsatB_005367 [Cannabis sativa]
MEYYVNTFFLLSLLTILFLSHSPQSAIATTEEGNNNNNINNKQKTGHHRGAKLISKVCQNVTQKAFCSSMLLSDPNTHNANLRGLGLIALKQAATNASDISEFIKTKLNDPNVDPEVQDGASDCLEFYIDAAEQLEDSVSAQISKAYKDVETWVNVAVSDSKSCDVALTGYDSVLGNKSQVFRWLCETALTINKMLVIMANFLSLRRV